MTQLTVVGSGDAFGSGGRFQTCLALAPAGEPHRLLIDCGATTLTALRRQDIDPNEITTIVITHLHGDHFGGLPFLILDGQFRRRRRDLTIAGPPGTGERLRTTMEALFPGSAAVEQKFGVHVREHSDGVPRRVDGWTITPYEVRHAAGAPAYGVQVRGEDGVVAYSGDTEWTEALLAVAEGADVFLCEGYSPAPVRWHLDLDTLGRQRDRFDCGRLVLTHLSPRALASDLGDWSVASDGLRLDV
jgi:ribonuclease BN (tRNA processing enzyme)